MMPYIDAGAGVAIVANDTGRELGNDTGPRLLLVETEGRRSLLRRLIHVSGQG